MKGTQEQQVKTKNNSKAMLHFIAIVLTVITIVSLAIGLFAWSKYTATQSGNANAAVAKWNFNLSLKLGSTTVTGSDSLNLATTQYETSSHIANGKIAPGTSGEFDIVIDTRGTEVSMLYDVDITMTNCPRNITFSKKGLGENSFTEISPMQTGDETARTRTISFSKYLTLNDVTTANTNDTTFVETIKWDWPYELTSGTDAEKTAYDNRDKADSGITATLNITATGSEVMNTPLSEATITYGSGSQIANGGTITLKMGDVATETTTLSLSNGLESVTFTSSYSTVAEVDGTGKVTAKKAGTSVITITGNETGKTFTINVIVKPEIELQVGDIILYTPSTINTYSWNQTLATSDAASDAQPLELKSGANQTYNIPEWYVLSIDGDNITMVPKTPSGGTVTLQGAQGYNNAVKLLNDACSTLYSDPSKGITARSIKIEDFENVINNYGRSSTLTTEQTSEGYNTQKYNVYSNYSKYPEIYASENKSVINGNTNSGGLGLSEQSTFIPRTAENNNNGIITNATSIQPYQTYYGFNISQVFAENSIYRTIFNNNYAYWIASRCVSLATSSYCFYQVRSMQQHGTLNATYVTISRGEMRGTDQNLFPVVFLSADNIVKTDTPGTYQVQ